MDAWRGRRVVIVGFARQGKALARHFSERGASVVITDLRPASELQPALNELAGVALETRLGGHPPEVLDGADLLCLSGGVPADLPLAQQARRLRIPITNDSQLFLEGCPAPTIGITGSAGKSTTTALLGEMAGLGLEGSDRRAWVGGNIGRPLISELAGIRPDDLVVMELSSFQLELMTRSPAIAVVLNLTPNHLDRHRTMDAYRAAKARMLDFQAPGDTAVLGLDDAEAWALRNQAHGRVVGFGRSLPDGLDGAHLRSGSIVVRVDGQETEVAAIDQVRLRGGHNLANVLAACAAAAAAGLPAAALGRAIRGFTGLPHRLGLVRRVKGVDWYDDSIATTPDRARAAIEAFEEPIVLLAGGRDKDLDWGDLARLIRRRVDHLVVFGEAADLIARAVGEPQPGDRLATVDRGAGLAEAVAAAARRAEAGEVVLLAPGATSFDEFSDFAERGQAFARLVASL